MALEIRWCARITPSQVSGVRNGWGNMGPSHADKTGKKGTKKIKQPDDGMACEVTMKMSIEPKKKKKKKKKKVRCGSRGRQ